MLTGRLKLLILIIILLKLKITLIIVYKMDADSKTAEQKCMQLLENLSNLSFIYFEN